MLLLGLSLLVYVTLPKPGAADIGDPHYDELGNGGYDVEHYAIALDVQPVANAISGTTTIVARATQALSALNLDLECLRLLQTTGWWLALVS